MVLHSFLNYFKTITILSSKETFIKTTFKTSKIRKNKNTHNFNKR